MSLLFEWAKENCFWNVLFFFGRNEKLLFETPYEWMSTAYTVTVCSERISFLILDFSICAFFSELPKVYDFFMHVSFKQPSYFDIVEFVSLFYIQCISGISLAFFIFCVSRMWLFQI